MARRSETAQSPCFFGKLPIHVEFIRHGGRAAELDELNDWVEAGLYRSRQSLGTAWQGEFDRLEQTRFLYASPGSSSILGGVCGPSRDQAGRRYPFILASHAPARPSGAEFDSLPIALSDFLEAAGSLAATGWIDSTLGEYRDRVEGMTWDRDDDPARDELERELSTHVAPAPWLEPRGHGAHDPAPALLFMLERLLGPDYVHRGVFQLPIAGHAWHVGFWLSLVRARAATPRPTLCLWNETGGRTRATVRLVFGRLEPEFFEPAFWPGRRSEHAYNLAGQLRLNRKQIVLAHSQYGTVTRSGSAAEVVRHFGGGE